MIPFRLYLYAAAALALLGGLWYVHHLKQLADRVPALEKAVKAEKAGRAKDRTFYETERKQNEEITHAHLQDIRRLESERDKPLPRLVCRTAPRAESQPAGHPHAAPEEHVGSVSAPDSGRDVSEQLLEYAIAAEANALQLDRLQEWVRSHQ